MIKSLKIRGVLVVVCLLSVADGIAQNFSQSNWYFGNTVRGIRFSRTDNTATLVNNKATPFRTGGSSVATDPTNANLLFYTDGSRVFDVTHAQMPNGSGLSGAVNANQPVAISPVPGFPNQYYIFTNSSTFTTGGSISVTTVDMNASGNDVFPEPRIGNVVLPINNTVGTGLTGRSEGMITIPHANGNDFWLITHQNGFDNYTVTLIGGGGSFTHTVVPNLTGLPISVANFSYHEGTGKIAVSPQTADRNVAILDFDNLNGFLTFDQFVFNTSSSTLTTQSIYDTEWSNSGRFLYISRHGEAGIPANVFQFDINSPGTSLAPVLSLAVNRSYGLQMAPDSAIYHLYQATAGGPFLLGRLTNTDTLAFRVVHTPDAFGGALNFAGTQFPSFSPRANTNLTVSFTSDGICSASPVSFYPLVSPGADSLVWNFGDGQTSSQWSPIHTYQNGGAFNVTVTAFLNGDSARATAPLNLTQFDLQLTLVQDTTACECTLPVNNGTAPCPDETNDDFSVTVQTQNGNPTSFTWSNGDTGPTLTPDSAGYYYVVVTDASGCTAYAGVNVREYHASDQRANIWYFGQNAGINFNNPPGVTAITGPVNTQEGVSVISDRNGQVILSTDGVHVYDRNDVEVPIPIPPGIGGEQGSTQSALILPVPGDETLYYIFTTQEVHGSNTYELRYSLYDIKLNNGDGGLAEINQLLFSRSTERITGAGNWLIAHEYGNNSFRAYPITGIGIGNPVISDIGSDHVVTDEFNGRGYMKLGGQNQLVVALPTFVPPTNFSNVLEFFDFDNTTGEITNFRSVNLNVSATTQQVYGIEFAGNKVFATLSGSPSFIREVYIDFQGNPVLITPPSPAINEELGAIQLGPDGQIYVAINNEPFLGTIQVNPDTLQLSNFTANGFPLAAGTQSLLGLPNFIQSVGNGPQLAGMNVSGFCLGDSTIFLGTGTDPIDTFVWSFGDGFGATTQDAMHLYDLARTYTVTLVVSGCGIDTLLTQNITIVAPPADPNFLPLGQQPVLCNGDLTLEAEPAPGAPGNVYSWSTGETTRTIVVSQEMRVDVTITNAQGCTSDGTIIVTDNRPQVDLGENQTVCQNEPVATLDAQNPGTSYQWFINEISNGNTAQTQPVNTAAPAFGIFEYRVRVFNPITLCVAKDSVVFTINESPDIDTPSIIQPTCGTPNGQIDLRINGPTGGLFSYLAVGTALGTTLQGIDQSTGTIPLTSLRADTYVVRVTDQLSSCATTISVPLSDNAITIAVAAINTCDPLILRVTHNAAVPYTYQIIDANTSTVVQTGSPGTPGTFDTNPGVPSGRYIVQISSGLCSSSSAPQTFNQAPPAVVSFIPDLCNAQITAQPAGAVSYDWSTSEAGSISGATNTATVTLNPGTWDLTVIVNNGINCPGTGNITVTVDPPQTITISQSDACEDQVTLTASLVGPYTYLWRNVTDATNFVGGSSVVVGLADNGDSFSVQAQSTITGCLYVAPPLQVFVAGDLQLAMTTTTPCAGAEFTLTGTSNIVGTNFQWGVNGNDIAGATQPTLIRNTGGLYRLTGSLPGCTETIRQLIILFPTTAGSLPARALICPDIANPDIETRQVVLDAGPNFISYNWLQGGVPLGITTRTHTATEEGIFGVELVNTYGCQSTDQTDVIEECNPRIVAPTAFRPGSTIATNSTFYVFTYFISNEDFQLFLYNRWGELVYQSSGLDAEGDQSKRWNGGYNNNAGQLLPAGTYSYVVKYRSSYRPQDGIQEKRGGVVLMR